MPDLKIEPPGDKNVLVFAAGLLTGTGFPPGSQYEVLIIELFTPWVVK
jgi:aldehyde:ferredoxin oxidoreductase